MEIVCAPDYGRLQTEPRTVEFFPRVSNADYNNFSHAVTTSGHDYSAIAARGSRMGRRKRRHFMEQRYDFDNKEELSRLGGGLQTY